MQKSEKLSCRSSFQELGRNKMVFLKDELVVSQYHTRFSAICSSPAYSFPLQCLNNELAVSQGTPYCPSQQRNQSQPSTR